MNLNESFVRQYTPDFKRLVDSVLADVKRRSSFVGPRPQYDEVYLVCRCGSDIGGTIIRGKPFSFTCLNCECVWTGEVSCSNEPR
jgi:hypothetical protein